MPNQISDKNRIFFLLNFLLVALTGLAGCAQPPVAPVTTSEPPLLAQTQVTRPAAKPVALRNGHPQSYTVRPGDTLWSIAERFLDAPWRWPEVWRQNPDIRDPDLIFPGNTIELYYEEQQPRLRLAAGERPTLKLSPQVRVASLSRPITAVPPEEIEPFTKRSVVATEAEWEEAPYVVGAAENRIRLGAPERIFVRGESFDQRHYRVFRRGETYRDPVTRHFLGLELIYIGDAFFEQEDEATGLAIFQLTTTARSLHEGDRVFPVQDEIFVQQFVPQAAPPDTEGLVIASLDTGVLMGRFENVVLNIGESQGMESGHVLAVQRAGRVTSDPVNGRRTRLPDESAGTLMIYRVFDEVSYALLMTTTRPIRLGDRVTAP